MRAQGRRDQTECGDFPQRSRPIPRLDPSCILNVVFYSPGISIHPGTSGSADSTLHLGTADSATVLFILVLLTVLTVLFSLVLLTVLTVTILLTVFTVTILLTVLTVSTLLTLYTMSAAAPMAGSWPFGPGCLGIPGTSFDPIRSISLSRSVFVPTSSKSEKTLPQCANLCDSRSHGITAVRSQLCPS